ncbi:MAG TPA: hypothetical protein VIL68_05560, partial [Propionibacteriaceae bacterium]
MVEPKPTEPVDPQPEPQPEPVAPSEPELVFSHGSDDAVAKALVALEGTRAPRRRRAASRPAGAPAPIDLDAITAALANPGTDAIVDSEDVVAEEEDDDEALALGDAEAQDEAELVDDEAADDVDGEDAPRRRRRRRGGRRRRRGPDDVDAESDEPSNGETEPEADAEAEESEAVEGDEPVSASSRR